MAKIEKSLESGPQLFFNFTWKYVPQLFLGAPQAEIVTLSLIIPNRKSCDTYKNFPRGRSYKIFGMVGMLGTIKKSKLCLRHSVFYPSYIVVVLIVYTENILHFDFGSWLFGRPLNTHSPEKARHLPSRPHHSCGGCCGWAVGDVALSTVIISACESSYSGQIWTILYEDSRASISWEGWEWEMS